MTTKRDFTQDAVDAARSVMLELVRLLGEYRDQVVVIGGWVPQLLLDRAKVRHVGSLDVDLAINHLTLREAGYRTICELLEGRGYVRDESQPFIFRRTVRESDPRLVVEVDLLAGEYEGTGAGHRTQRVQDAQPRKARGCDLAFEGPVEVSIEGNLPGGARDSATIKVASIVPFIVMKAMALHDRLKEKDAYDIYFCLLNYPGGIEALADAFRPDLSHALVREGLQKIREKFASPDHAGPRHVADFFEVRDPEERARIQRDAFERVAALLAELGVVSGD